MVLKYLLGYKEPIWGQKKQKMCNNPTSRDKSETNY